MRGLEMYVCAYVSACERACRCMRRDKTLLDCYRKSYVKTLQTFPISKLEYLISKLQIDTLIPELIPLENIISM